MNLTIKPLESFKKSVKKLAKRYKNIAKDLYTLEEELTSNPACGTHIGSNCYKIRVANSSIPTGKSGGFRVIYYKKIKNTIYLMDIYSKSDMENITDEKILEILRGNGLN
ncbi:MAG: type II toxin-antitoxin system RelE/ParE family toxin [Campylobacterota bacterium]|nr:type II toxin-antitoxin system RelE/ParE family toxin [Campylobacterota bacterium]